jgi:titin
MKSKHIAAKWASNKMLPGVNIILEVTVTEEKKWSYTREEETVSEHREEEYEDYEDYEEYKEFEEYEPTEEYDQYDEYAEREVEHYEEHEEYVTGMTAPWEVHLEPNVIGWQSG